MSSMKANSMKSKYKLLKRIILCIAAYFLLFFIFMIPDEGSLNDQTGEIDFTCAGRFQNAHPIVVAGKTDAIRKKSVLNFIFYPAESLFNIIRGKGNLLEEMRARSLDP